jgi:hypothetical protein
MGEETDSLKDVTDTTAQADWIGGGGVLAVDTDLAATGLYQPIDHLECRRLPTARSAEQDDGFASCDLEGEPIYGMKAAWIGF